MICFTSYNRILLLILFLSSVAIERIITEKLKVKTSLSTKLKLALPHTDHHQRPTKFLLLYTLTSELAKIFNSLLLEQ